MECPKCHSYVEENQAVCPKCHKVLYLTCPNCKSLSDSPTCPKCGYTILVKCAKCSKMVPIEKGVCPKCGFSTKNSLAYQECESDEFASIIVKFASLKKIKKILKSQELYSKFLFKLKNLLYAQIKGVDCNLIVYNDVFVINMSKELSFTTSSNKAIRLALKIINAFVGLNMRVLDELAIPIKLELTVIKKNAEDLQELNVYENNVKPLNLNKNLKKYLKGLQVILDQYVSDEVNKDYKMDSLYTLEENGKTTVFYEVLLDSYVLPPSAEEDSDMTVKQQNIVKPSFSESEQDMYSFKVFDINAKCSFQKVPTACLSEKLLSMDFSKTTKIVSLRSDLECKIPTSELIENFEKKGYRILSVTCTEELSYKPWGFFEMLFREYFSLSQYNQFIDVSLIKENDLKRFKSLFDFILRRPIKAMTPEDSRFGYMELWGEFLSVLNDTVIIVDGFDNIDDTSIQTLELYFDNYKKIKPNFIFINSKKTTAHSKIKTLLRTSVYTEITLQKSSMELCLSTLKSEATDFIQSFYFEKIKENFRGSYMYFVAALKYLEEVGVLIDFENKLIIKNKKSVVIPSDLHGLYKARFKNLGKNQGLSFILAYSAILGSRLDIKTLEVLGVKDVNKNIKILCDLALVTLENSIIKINNYTIVNSIIASSLKRDADEFLTKNILAQLGKFLDDTTLARIMGKIRCFKEEYLTLWKNSQFAIKVGDYDAYLKNSLGFLSLVEHIESNLSKDEVVENKKEVYNNILLYLYNYSPEKIYFIENLLLIDAINLGDDEKIVKLSNLMLQGALIVSNYTDALALLHNILSRMPAPTLVVDGLLNTKFLLLSLVRIEVLYNIGNFQQCVEVANDILKVLEPKMLEKIKPASFSLNLFVSHILDIFRLVGFAKLFQLDEDLEDFFEQIHVAFDIDLPEKDSIIALQDFLSGKVYNCGNIEEYSAFSKIIFLILQELSILDKDYKRFAQNIYQAKLLAADIHNREAELICDLLIAYAYYKMDVLEKSEAIYNDVLCNAEKSAMFNLILLSKFLLAKQKMKESKDEALNIINDSLAMIRKNYNQAQILYVLFEKLYIEMAEEQNMSEIDIESEQQKLVGYKEKLSKILG